MTSLNPAYTVGDQIMEALLRHRPMDRTQARARALEMLAQVRIPAPEQRLHEYPHQLSGGMRQRVMIAMALVCQPRLLIADEPTTALDVTIQAQILALMAQLQSDMGTAIVLITHDLGVVAEVADRVAVMYGGRVVETGTVREIFKRPRHPYTVGLLRSIPRLDGGSERLVPIVGQPPTPARLPSGCTFHPRCALGRERAPCQQQEPPLQAVDGPPDAGLQAHASACHFAAEVSTLLAGTAPAAAAAAAAPPSRGEPLLEVRGLQVYFPVRSGLLRRRTGWVRAVDGVDLTVHPGETVGLVGESGCGKTTTGRAIMGLIPKHGGSVRFDGRDITRLPREGMRQVRRHLQYIFQDPYSSLNPIKTAGEIVAEPLRIHGLYDEAGGARWVAQLFELVGLSPTMASRYPREFSGGQRQRIGIARALSLKPRMLILDEPVAALDVSIQAQVVNLLQDLQRELGLAYLFIAHDLSVVRHICDRVTVMYLGRVVEESDAATLYGQPVHPYTQSLMSAVPLPDPDARHQRRRIILEGDIPNPARPPSGCHFHPRCFKASELCHSQAPGYRAFPGLPTHVACHHAGGPA